MLTPIKKIKSLGRLNELTTLSTPIMFLYFNNIKLVESQSLYQRYNTAFFSSRLFKSLAPFPMLNSGSFLVISTSASNLANESTIPSLESKIGSIGVNWTSYGIQLESLKRIVLIYSAIKANPIFLGSMLSISFNFYKFFFNYIQLLYLFHKNLIRFVHENRE